MTKEEHYRCLENMYSVAPVNELYLPAMKVGEGEATVEMEVGEKFHHTAGAAHGSVYFKMLDDAAFFAANSVEREVFVLTVSFTTYMTRPVVSGRIRSQGRVVSRTRTQLIAEAVLYDERGREIGRGNGLFVRGPTKLEDVTGYGL